MNHSIDCVFSDQDGERYFRIRWATSQAIVPVLALMDPKHRVLGSLAAKGLDFGPHNKSAFLKSVASTLATMTIVRPLTHTGGHHGAGFLLGATYYEDKEQHSANALASLDRPMSVPSIIPTVAGTMRVQQAGTLEDWITAFNGVAHRPRIRAAVYASLAAPLLRILRAPNFALQFAGPSCTGKSAAVAAAASVWGNPMLESPSSFTLPWDTAPEYATEASRILTDLPTCLDGMQLGDKAATNLLASVLSGAKGQGNRWSTTVICSASDVIDDLAATDQLASRCITLWGLPFGSQTKDANMERIRLMARLEDAYGTVGVQFIKGVMARRAGWPKWRESYLESKEEWQSRIAGLGGMASNAAAHIATLLFAGKVFHALFPEAEGDIQEVADDLWDWLRLNTRRSSKSQAATSLLADWILRNEPRISGLRSKALGPPAEGWFGTMDKQGRIWIPERILSDFLKGAGFKPEQILGEWRETKGVLLINGRHTKLQRVGSATMACVCPILPES